MSDGKKTPRRFENPFRPGAGHKPPFLAGRDEEKAAFRKLLKQTTITDNLVLTGLRGVGKTVLLDDFREIAISQKWLWVGTDLSESASLTEQTILTRLLADLSAVTSAVEIQPPKTQPGLGFGKIIERKSNLGFHALLDIFNTTPGLMSDKLKSVLEVAWSGIQQTHAAGLIFAYDEAQNLGDHVADKQYPLSLILDVFQSIQRKGIPFMLVMSGLPTLFPKLVEARTFAERMFHVEFLNRLNEKDSRDAIQKPISKAGCPHPLSDDLVNQITTQSGGYPYFIQFICREVYDVAVQKADAGLPLQVSIEDITRKLDADFFAGRWARATDRQRDLLRIIASLPNRDEEFTVQEVVNASKGASAPFSSSHVNQMLSKLSSMGLVYKNRHGKYAFAVPLLGQFISRQLQM